jgi:predicted RNA binding protein YcfA (HicA-like mRNA interferase family)
MRKFKTEALGNRIHKLDSEHAQKSLSNHGWSGTHNGNHSTFTHPDHEHPIEINHAGGTFSHGDIKDRSTHTMGKYLGNVHAPAPKADPAKQEIRNKIDQSGSHHDFTKRLAAYAGTGKK